MDKWSGGGMDKLSPGGMDNLSLPYKVSRSEWEGGDF